MISTKRKKSVVTMRTRLEAISRIEQGEPLKKIAQEYGVGISTVSDWKKHRKHIQEFCALMLSKDCLEKRVTTKKAKDSILDDALYKWYREEVERVKHVPGPVLQKKALCLNEELGTDPNFSASSGWLCRWKARHGIGPHQLAAKKTKNLESPFLTTTSATTTAGTTSSFTTTSLTTVTVTTTMSTMTTPTCSIVTSAYQQGPSTSANESIVIKEEYIDKLEESHQGLEMCDDVDNSEFQLDQDEPDYAQEIENDYDVNIASNENEEGHSDGYMNKEMLDQEIAKSQYIHLQDFCDNHTGFNNINPTRQATYNPSHIPAHTATRSANNQNLEQMLRVHYLKTMIKKEKELLDVKLEIYKTQLLKEQTEFENNKTAHTVRMENLYLEKQLLNLQLRDR